jgi:hypothetical protein
MNPITNSKTRVPCTFVIISIALLVIAIATFASKPAHANENGKCSTVAVAKKATKPTPKHRKIVTVVAAGDVMYFSNTEDAISFDRSGKATNNPAMLPVKAATVLPETGNDVAAASATDKAALDAVRTEHFVLANLIEE